MTAYSTSMMSLLQAYAGDGGVNEPVDGCADIILCFVGVFLNTLVLLQNKCCHVFSSVTSVRLLVRLYVY